MAAARIIEKRLHFGNVQAHSFHMVNESPWPLLGACAALLLTLGGVWFFHWGENYLLLLGFISVCFIMLVWWKDVVVEATYLGYHTQKVIRGLKLGMVLFIVSEIMFFFSFFWAFFHASLAPSVAFGSAWPPLGVPVLNPLKLPFLNTIILLSSGVSVTWAHHIICNLIPMKAPIYLIDFVEHGDMYYRFGLNEIYHPGDAKVQKRMMDEAEFALRVTLFLALEFTCCQAYEYYEALFYINDGVYGSSFYIATGFHGLHVIIGTIFLTIALVRLVKSHFSFNHHVGLELAIWYWHFVDVVWLVLYIFIYCWSGGFMSMYFW